MAVIAARVAPNFATGNYTRINKVEFLCAPDDTLEDRWVFHLGFYASEEARRLNPRNPMHYDTVTIPLSEFGPDLRDEFYAWVMGSHLFSGITPETDVPGQDPVIKSLPPLEPPQLTDPLSLFMAQQAASSQEPTPAAGTGENPVSLAGD